MELGHRRIAFIGGPRGAASSQGRLGGYRAGLESAGLVANVDLTVHGDFSWRAGLDLGEAVLARPDRPSAIFAASDATAFGVLEAARRTGLRVPEELSVVGFDDTDLAAQSTPPLTTVRQPLQEMGGTALRILLRLAAGDRLDSLHIELATQLVVRHSTGPPAGTG